MKYVLDNCQIITQNKNRDIIFNGSIVISDKRILAVKPRRTKRCPGFQRFDLEGAVVIPGLINSHVHLGEVVYRGLINGVDTKGYIEEAEKLNARIDKSGRRRGVIARYALLELIKNGITTICASRAWPWSEEMGVRNISCYMVMNSDKLRSCYHNLEKSFAAYQDEFAGADLTVPGLMLHSLNYCDRDKLDQLRFIRKKFRDLNFFIHLSENRAMERSVRLKYGTSSVRALEKSGLLDKNTFLVHALFLSRKDAELVKQSGAAVITCPTSNLVLENEVLHISALRKLGIRVLIATDGPSPNIHSDIVGECRLAYLLNKKEHKQHLKAEFLLDSVTRTPAAALGLADDIGSIEPGKCADLVVLPPPALSGKALIEDLVKRGHEPVESVIVNGRFIYKRGRLVFRDGQKITADFLNIL